MYSDDLKGKSCLIVDDICANGRTFVELAKSLKKKNAGEITLYVTHGFFGAKLQPLKSAGISKFITTSSVCNLIDEDLHILNIQDMIYT